MSDPAIDLIERFRAAEQRALQAGSDPERFAAVDEAWRLFLALAAGLDRNGVLSANLSAAAEIDEDSLERDCVPMHRRSHADREHERRESIDLSTRLLLELGQVLGNPTVDAPVSRAIGRRLNNVVIESIHLLEGRRTDFFAPLTKGRGKRPDRFEVKEAKRRLVRITFYKSGKDSETIEQAWKALGGPVAFTSFNPGWKKLVDRETRASATAAGKDVRNDRVRVEDSELARECEIYLDDDERMASLKAWALGQTPFDWGAITPEL